MTPIPLHLLRTGDATTDAELRLAAGPLICFKILLIQSYMADTLTLRLGAPATPHVNQVYRDTMPTCTHKCTESLKPKDPPAQVESSDLPEARAREGTWVLTCAMQ